jgi:hypothetical protein
MVAARFSGSRTRFVDVETKVQRAALAEDDVLLDGDRRRRRGALRGRDVEHGAAAAMPAASRKYRREIDACVSPSASGSVADLPARRRVAVQRMEARASKDPSEFSNSTSVNSSLRDS